MKQSKYYRLPGRHTSWLTRSSLWACDDHVLLVENNGIVERYCRYYYGDIQGFTVLSSLRGRRTALATGIPFLLLLAVSGLPLASFIAFEWLLLNAALALPLLLVFVVNWFKGPTCTTVIYTAVADVVLLPLGRQRAAFRTIGLLVPSIEAVQGSLDPSQLGFFVNRDAPVTVSRKVSGDKGTPTNPIALEKDVGVPSGKDAFGTVENRWILMVGGTELLQTLAAFSLVALGGGTIRQSALFGTIVLAMLAASAWLSRGQTSTRWVGVMVLVHALLVGVGSVIAFYVSVFRESFRTRGASPAFNFSSILDPSVPVALPVLWLSCLGSLGLVIVCLFLSNHAKRPR